MVFEICREEGVPAALLQGPQTPRPDGSYIDVSVDRIKPDHWRPHGVRYRMAWVKNGKCRVLFDNHHGKEDHFHIDGEEFPYAFTTVERLARDFAEEVRKLGGPE